MANSRWKLVSVVAYYGTTDSFILKRLMKADSCVGERRQLQPFTTSEALLLEIISPAVIWHPHNRQTNVPALF